MIKLESLNLSLDKWAIDREKITHEKYMFWNHELKVHALASLILPL